MKYLLTLTTVFVFLFSSGQTGTATTPDHSALKRGMYRTYQEFTSNSPSIDIPFEVTYICISKKDSTIVGASYRIADSSKMKEHIWGFCDGKDVFINHSPGLIGKHFWRLESLGPYPFFSYPEKDIAAMGPPLMAIATVALTASADPILKLRTVTETGGTQAASIKRVAEWLAAEPDLLAEFNRTGYKGAARQDPTKTEARYPDDYKDKIQAIREYLLKLNQRLQEKKR